MKSSSVETTSLIPVLVSSFTSGFISYYLPQRTFLVRAMTENKDLPVPDNSLPPARVNWIVNEFARTNNKLATQMKYRKVWDELLTDTVIDEIMATNKGLIKELHAAYKNSVDSHDWGDAFTRMKEFKDLAELAKSGTVVGLTKHGEPIVREDLRLALDCVKAAREEQDRERKYELELLKILLLTDRLPKAGGVSVNNPVSASEDVIDDATDAEISTDTDQYFGN